jgi:ribosome biogenesis GTPase A
MAIQWFPGHMNKTRRLLQEHIESVDGVLEIVDARAPLSSRNPLLNEIIGGKPRLVLLNKCDLCDTSALRQWLAYFEHQKIAALPVSAKARKNVDRLKGEVEKFMKKRGGMRERRPKALIVGVPNCGKSTLINAIARQKKAQVADKPGVTRDTALYKVGNFDLYDSPGTLWPNLEDQEAAARLAALGAVKDEVYIASEAFAFIYPFLKDHYAARLENRYAITPADDAVAFAAAVAARSGKNDDPERGVMMVFKDIREGRLGLLCLELPPAVL